MVSHLLHQRLRMTALTLQEEAASLGQGGLCADGAQAQAVAGLQLWKWMRAAQQAATAAVANGVCWSRGHCRSGTIRGD